MTDPKRLSDEQIAELERLEREAWVAPWVAHTFEIDCPCPNGEHCGDSHSCEQIEAPEAYPASPAAPAAPGDGQCVVQIDVPGLESLAGPTAAFIAAARNAIPALLSEVRARRAAEPEGIRGAAADALRHMDGRGAAEATPYCGVGEHETVHACRSYVRERLRAALSAPAAPGEETRADMVAIPRGVASIAYGWLKNEPDDSLGMISWAQSALAAAIAAPAPLPAPRCATCGEPATCLGRYEGTTEPSHACDACCGHGNEDGTCAPVAAAAPEERGDEGDCVCGHAAMAHYLGGCLIIGGPHGGCGCRVFRRAPASAAGGKDGP